MGERVRYRTFVYDSARWDWVELRDDDIVISTPTKCGTTWTQMICALLVFQDPALPAPLTDLSPWVDIRTEKAERVRAALDAQRHRRFIKSHTPFDGLPRRDGVTYITVGRDPRDVALSWDNHMENMNIENLFGAIVETGELDDMSDLLPEAPPVRSEDPVERFWAWIEEDESPSGNISGLRGMLHHLETFWDHRDEPDVLLVHYADLQADLEGEMRRLAGALSIEVDEARWPALVRAATFDEMKDRATELAPQTSVAGFWQDDARFFNKGTSGQWRAMFGPGDQERYAARVNALVPPGLATWVHEGGRR